MMTMTAQTITITVKLFASLMRYLPPQATGQQIALTVPQQSTAADLIRQLRLPEKQCHLVLVNGVYLPPSQRGAEPLPPGAVLAIWPQVAGG